jgi:hypothetical protein
VVGGGTVQSSKVEHIAGQEVDRAGRWTEVDVPALELSYALGRHFGTGQQLKGLG